jgi:hypothetical protein
MVKTICEKFLLGTLSVLYVISPPEKKRMQFTQNLFFSRYIFPSVNQKLKFHFFFHLVEGGIEHKLENFLLFLSGEIVSNYFQFEL